MWRCPADKSGDAGALNGRAPGKLARRVAAALGRDRSRWARVSIASATSASAAVGGTIALEGGRHIASRVEAPVLGQADADAGAAAACPAASPALTCCARAVTSVPTGGRLQGALHA